MGRHDAPKGQRGQLPSGEPLVRSAQDSGAHRPSRAAAQDTDPEPEPVVTDDNAEGWRN